MTMLIGEHKCLCYGWGMHIYIIDSWTSNCQMKDVVPSGLQVIMGACMQFRFSNAQISVKNNFFSMKKTLCYLSI